MKAHFVGVMKWWRGLGGNNRRIALEPKPPVQTGLGLWVLRAQGSVNVGQRWRLLWTFVLSAHFGEGLPELLVSPAAAQTGSVTYQGRIDNALTPPDGLYDLQIQLYDAPQAGLPASGLLLAVGVPVTNAFFSVIGDFGLDPFSGAARWLEIAYRTNSSGGGFQTNATRIPLTSTPYAIQASRAVSVSGPIAATNLTGVVADALLSPNVALVAGNNGFTGTNNFIGRVNLTNANNQLAGTFSGNLSGGTLAGNGGGITNLTGGNLVTGSVLASALANGQVVKSLNGLKDVVSLVAGSNVTLNLSGGGITISAVSGPVGPSWGLSGNSGTGPWSFLGTADNQPLELRVNNSRALRIEPASTGEANMIGGLSSNAVAAGVWSAVIAGGGEAKSGGSNFVASSYSSIGGGRRNTIGSGASDSVIGGGLQNSVLAPQSLVASGFGNVIATNSASSVIVGGYQNAVQSGSSYVTINGGVANSSAANYSMIGGGAYNMVQVGANQAAVVGGYLNLVQSNSPNSVVVGGANNTISNTASYAVIIGGYLNNVGAGAQMSTIGGGRQNALLATHGVIGGGYGNIIGSNSPSAVIGGGSGVGIQANAGYSAIGGGLANVIQSGAQYAAIAGGVQNTIGTNAQQAAVLGGYLNRIGTNALNAVIAGGASNTISNNASFATVLGGNQNTAGGVNSLAAGNRAKANHLGSFVWGDSTVADWSSTAPNQFLVRANGGVGIGIASPQSALHVAGTITATNFVGSGAGLTNLSLSAVNLASSLSPSQIPNLDASKVASGVFGPAQIPALDATIINTGTFAEARLGTNVALLSGSPVFAGPVVAPAFNYASDRNLKQGFKAIVGEELLEKVISLPITRWVYKNDPDAEHIGPMAQDFHRAFAVGGGDDKHISAVDANGVALAAIQLLVEKLRAKDAELGELRRRLERLEATVDKQKSGSGF